MCGIAGFSLSPNEQVNAKRLAKSLLLSIESRGLDATGFAYLDTTGQFQVHKSDVAASEFVKRRLCLPRRASTAIMHTRFATQGDPLWNENNHPIATGTVVGVHNGHISNDDELFTTVELLTGHKGIRLAQVDSEAAFAALGWTAEPVKDVLETLRGSAALAWLDMQSEHPETLHLARVSSSPLIIGETEGGSVIFASTEAAVAAAAAVGGMVLAKVRTIAEGTYLQVLHGDINDVKTFQVPADKWSYRSYGYGSSLYKGSSFHFEEDDYDYEPLGARRLTVVRNTAMGSTLDARLAAEEPDFGAGDNDDDRYEQWLRENNAELDRRIESEKDDRFELFCAQPWLHGGYLADPTLPAPTVDTTAMYLSDDKHVVRETAIEKWLTGLSCSNEIARTGIGTTLKAGVRPGDIVTTELNGCRVEGVIMAVPADFPGGWYHIRAFVFNERRLGNHEAVFIVRKHYEFALATVPQKELTQ